MRETPFAAVCAALLIFGASAAPALAASEAPASESAGAPKTAPSDKLSPADQQFVQDAGQAGATEIAASKLALTKSNNPDVKRFAERMIADHTKLARNLDIVAKRHGITAPPSADSAVIGNLETLNGDAFDHAYIEKVAVEGHQKAVELFKKESEAGNDALLKGAETKALPIIKHHYGMAQQLAKSRAAAA